MNNYKKLILIIVLAIITSFFLIEHLGKILNKQLYNYVNIESKRVVSNIVNNSINEVLENNELNNLFIIEKNSNGEVELLDYDTQEVNRLLKIINEIISHKLLALEEGKTKDFEIATSLKSGNYPKVKNGIICEVALGSLKNNAFYSNYGPYIPIKLSFQGSVVTKIKTNLTAYGFNSLVVEVSIISEINQRISLPVASKDNKITIEAPLTLKIIQGVVPEQYYEKQLEKAYPQITP